MKLSGHQIDHVRNIINNGGIDIQSLRDDVLDHLCRVIEMKMNRGKTFDDAVNESVYELAPNDLKEIQNETTFLLNSNKIIAMKKVMYFTGMLSAMAFVLGWTFGMLHWLGATELSIGGFLGFVLIFIPLYTIDYFKVKIQRALTEKLRLIFGILSALLVAASVIFKLLHLTGADILLLSGAGLFVFGFLPFLFFTMYKKSIA